MKNQTLPLILGDIITFSRCSVNKQLLVHVVTFCVLYSLFSGVRLCIFGHVDSL